MQVSQYPVNRLFALQRNWKQKAESKHSLLFSELSKFPYWKGMMICQSFLSVRNCECNAPFLIFVTVSK